MFVYLGREDGIFKVKDTEDGKVDFFTEDELRFAIMQVGKIEGLSIDSWGNIVDSKNIILVCAPTVKTYDNRGGNLAKAKDVKNDEFYTRSDDVGAELGHYSAELFKDKVIYCPTDVSVVTGKTQQSKFVKYFQMKAHMLQFKRLIATCRVDHAANEKSDQSFDDVQNCYVLERMLVPENDRRVLLDDGTVKVVVGEFMDVDNVLKYKLSDGSLIRVPTHISNQAVKDSKGAMDIVRRFVSDFTKSGRIISGTVDTGKTWDYRGHALKNVWCYNLQGWETAKPLDEDCYVFSRELYIDNWCPFMTDADGTPVVEEVDGGYVGLRVPAYYTYVESDYHDYPYHCPPDIEFESGDFRSSFCCSMLEQSDIVCTNPPFSLFSEFMAWLLPANKLVLVIGNMNAITYKEVWPYIKSDKLWLGHHPLGTAMWFSVPDEDKKKLMETKRKGQGWKEINGEVVAGIAACWFTNLDNDARHTPMMLTHMYASDPDMYPEYDNYSAINVDKVTHIPVDYQGVIGVPITFIQKYCPEQFEIVGASESEGAGFSNGLWSGKIGRQPFINGKKLYKRIFIRRR